MLQRKRIPLVASIGLYRKRNGRKGLGRRRYLKFLLTFMTNDRIVFTFHPCKPDDVVKIDYYEVRTNVPLAHGVCCAYRFLM